MKTFLVIILLVISSICHAAASSIIAVDSTTAMPFIDKLHYIQYLVNGKSVDSATYYLTEQKLIQSIKQTYQEGQRINFYDEYADRNRSGIIIDFKYNGLVLLDEYNDTASLELNPQKVKLEIIRPFEKMPSNKQLKKMYSKTSYSYQKGDKYIPILVSVPSLLIPGLGQVICGDVFRGIGYLGGTALSFVTIIYGGLLNWGDSTPLGNSLMIVGAAGFVFFPVTSAIQSYKLAKYKNLYYRDLNQFNNVQVGLKPWIHFRDENVAFNTQSVGLSLNIQF